MDTPRQLIDALTLFERLKQELRHSWLSDGRRESVAEHCWQMAMMALLLHRELEHPVDIARTLKLVLVHDIVEAEAGDVPFFEVSHRQASKREREAHAIASIRDRLPAAVGAELFALWHEFEDRATPEARFAGALDQLEVQLQHNLADISTWEPVEHELVYTKMDRHCAHDAFLRAFCAAVKGDAETKLSAAGVDVAELKARLGVAAA